MTVLNILADNGRCFRASEYQSQLANLYIFLDIELKKPWDVFASLFSHRLQKYVSFSATKQSFTNDIFTK
jgi:hypothetical protein